MFYINCRVKCELRPKGVISALAWWGQHRATTKFTKQIS